MRFAAGRTTCFNTWSERLRVSEFGVADRRDDETQFFLVGHSFASLLEVGSYTHNYKYAELAK